MAKEKKEKQADGKAKKRGMSGKWKIVLIIFTLITMALLRTGIVFVIIAMLPSIVAYYIDQTRHRYTFRSIFFCNASGLMPYFATLVKHGPRSDALHAAMYNPITWFIIFGAAFIGYLLTSIAPLLAQSLIGGMNQTQVRGLQRAQKKIESEWGADVAQFGTEKN